MAEVSKAVLVTGCSSGIGHDGGAPGGRGMEGLRDRSPRRVDRGPRRQGLRDAGARRHRRVLDAHRRWTRSSRPKAPSGCSSTTPATARAAPSRRCPWTTSAASSRPTSSGWRMCQRRTARDARAGLGKIVNISSMGGRLTFPGGGAYHATKHAVEAFSDALRFEVGGFGVDVILIEPGLITTKFGEVGAASVGESRSTVPTRSSTTRSRRGTAEVYEGASRSSAGRPRSWPRRSRRRSRRGARRPATSSRRRRGWRSASER